LGGRVKKAGQKLFTPMNGGVGDEKKSLIEIRSRKLASNTGCCEKQDKTAKVLCAKLDGDNAVGGTLGRGEEGEEPLTRSKEN